MPYNYHMMINIGRSQIFKSSKSSPKNFKTQKQIIKESAGRDSFFVNYSDGQPYFTSKDYYYSGPSAYRHVKNQIDKFKANGIKVMSFFLSSYDWGGDSPSMGAFKKMYGQDAIQINPTQLVPLAKEFNKKFLQK